MENVGVLIGLIFNIVIVLAILAVVGAAFNRISHLLKLKRNNDQLALTPTNEQYSFKPYPTTYKYNTYLTKECAFEKLKECAAHKTQLEENVYLQLVTEGGKHYIIPQHSRPERELTMKIEIAIDEVPGYATTVSLTFKLTPLMEKLLIAALALQIIIFTSAALSRELGLELGIERLMWPSLIITLVTIMISWAQYYGSIGRYLKLIKGIHGV